ncbi:EAL domain-containing protein [Terasakiella sp. A23]|uniref:EAL domain-containing protein n=1 Tax=Terasakiella sp. FCG-A23 TaxID=3080561 RepID=UPI0029537AB5|nr:EAL domain-containing protein [Terasakiella sp. A23]MDV7339540.1 EAL domain-containing protein [Terasakiella sp. A23]
MSQKKLEASILVVDDDPVMLKLVAYFFEQKNYAVESCASANEAMAVLREKPFDLVILDHYMSPGISGLEMLKEIRADGIDVAVVMLTGASDQELVIESMQSGALDFIKKTKGKKFFDKLERGVLRALHVHGLEKQMKQTHAALEESEKRYRQLFQGCQAAFLIIDPEDGKIVDANKAACEFYGYDLSDLLDKKISDINTLSPEEVSSEMALAKEERRTHFYFKHQVADGSIRHVEVHSGPLDVDGKAHLYSIIHDISDRHRAESFVAGQHRTLEKLAKLRPLETVLDELTLTLEDQKIGAYFAIFSVTDQGKFHLESAPNLPADFVLKLRNTGIDETCHLVRGSCGFLLDDEGDLSCDTCLARTWMESAGMADIVTEPIYSSKQTIIGAFCAFFTDQISEKDRLKSHEFMKKNVSLAGVTIEHYKQVQSINDQAEFLQTVIDAVPTPIYYKGADGLYAGCNTAMADFFEQPKDEIIGRKMEDFYPQESQKFTHVDAQLLETGGNAVVEDAFNRSDCTHHVVAHKARFIGPDGKAGIVGAVMDITERKLSENELRLAQTVFDTTSEAIVVTDLQNRIQAVNPSFTHVTGYSEQEVLGRDPGFLSSGRHDKSFYNRMWKQLQKTGRWQGEIWNRRKNGDLYAEWLSISAVYDPDKNVSQYVAVFSDITKRKKAEELIRHQANYDALTNLPNRNLFLDRLSRSMMRAKRQDTQVALMFLDLDRFKWVNDTLGHNTGDMLLQEAAVRISKCVRETDTVSRLGGDEFTIVLPDLKHTIDVEKVARKVLAALAEPFNISGHEIFVSGSVGITVFPDDGAELELLLRNADTAMYRAKEGGRNDFRFFTSEMNAEAHQQMILEGDMRRGLERDEFVVHYQPVVDVKTGRVVSCEALVRWEHPRRGLIGPGYFIGIAEETGLINMIGDSVLRQVCDQVNKWQHDPVMKDVRVAVNLSTRQLQNENLLQDLMQVVNEAGVSPLSLTLEVTETLVMQDPEGAAKLLEDIRAQGFKVALDDFGTGYSSLNYLKRFSFDVLKIDRSFIMDIESDEGDAALVEAIIVMAHKLGIKVVAEGVESQLQKDFVTRQACDFIQGYFYSKPVDEKGFHHFCNTLNA